MTSIRFKALDVVQSRANIVVKTPSNRISDFYAANVFDKAKMKQYLSKDAYTAVEDSINNGKTIDRAASDQIASAMKTWAIEKGATHYTHWFQPLTGSTAEKHDSFFEPSSDGRALEKFSGDALVQQEPDASSFPNGGIRNTFEARGYTAWDPSSPAFIMENGSGSTLCIPTVFVSYTGEALDYKAPLLKALHILDKAAVEVCQFFDKNIQKVNASLGIEQEYFLVDIALYNARPDLMLTGRTLFGHMSAKGQQLEDHYFGSIPDRVLAYMVELETEAIKLGIPLKTRHNEVAPSQFECAPIYEEINLAIDHNQLLMDLMDKVARRHGFKVLLHEKPYAGVNGSGKHNNWSLITDTGKNLLAPGKTPKNNLMFLTFFVNTIKAVSEHADLLRASIASINNDHRLGANEAPPAIISIFLGSQLDEVLNEVETSKINKKADTSNAMWLGIPKIPQILLDNTDRNRTSPFAFTGNRFEFRAVGSSANCASAMIALNSVVAHQLVQFKAEVDALIEKDIKKDEAIFQVLKKYITACKAVRFDGNGYSQAWAEEAERRGLTNIKSVPKALEAYLTKKSLKVFEDLGIYTHGEIEARVEVEFEKYMKKIQIESRVLGDLASNHIVPIAIEYQTSLIDNVKGLKEIFSDAEYKQLAGARLDLIRKISGHITEIKSQVTAMTEARKVANLIEEGHKKAHAYEATVAPYLSSVRYHIDKLEEVVDNELWPLPKYRELLFTK